MADNEPKNVTTLPNVRNPQTDSMMETFDTEQLSNDVLLNPRHRDAGRSIPSEAGQVNVVPTGYSEELRKDGKQRADMRNYSARPSSVVLFNWEGVPSDVPIAYDAGGGNPSISRYLRKKHCNGCSHNGFITPICPYCSSSDVIQLLYQHYEQVPVKRNWYGEVPCLCSAYGEMEGACPRDGQLRDGRLTGFLSLQQMLMHANPKHPREYGIWQTTRQQPVGGVLDLTSMKAELMAELRAQILAEMQGIQAETPTVPFAKPVFGETCDACGADFIGLTLEIAEEELLAHMLKCTESR